jgi:phage baseplate assembly protein gpV
MIVDNKKYSMIFPARIVEYFPEDQTATIQISAETVFSDENLRSRSTKRKPLQGVPVHTPSGGGWAMTMPIKKGDTCLVVFSQVGYDHWLVKDQDTAGNLAGLPVPWLKRQFSDDDGFAMVGFNTLPRAIDNYSDDGSQWRNDDSTQSIHLKDDLAIVVDSPTSITINAPNVIVNSENATINATTLAKVISPTIKLIATTLVDVVSPLFKCSGNITATGIVTGSALAASSGGISMAGGGATMGLSDDPNKPDTTIISGNIEVDQIEVVGTRDSNGLLVEKGKVNGIVVEEHIHTSSTSGGPTSGPNNLP